MANPGTLIKNKIHTIRGVQVMPDSDLAELYGIEVKALNQAVKRNKECFPEDFMFQLTEHESAFLRSHTVTAKFDWSKNRFLPYVFYRARCSHALICPEEQKSG